jgi:hypothetical protein
MFLAFNYSHVTQVEQCTIYWSRRPGVSASLNRNIKRFFFLVSVFLFLKINVYIIETCFSNFTTKLIFKRFSYNLYYLLFQILKIFKIFILFLFARKLKHFKVKDFWYQSIHIQITYTYSE